jgi:hypothetical protein
LEETWHATLCVIVDHNPATFWCMSNGAVFWWMPDRSQLGRDRFNTEPFTYAEIVSVTVFDTLPMGPGGWLCNWDSLRNGLLGIVGLRVEELRDVHCPPACPPNKAMRLTFAP